MLKKLFIVLFFVSITAFSQQTISGKVNPVNDELSWISMYQLKGAKQVYITNVTIENGVFKIEIPASAEKGMYRLKYRMDNESFVDVIYSGENISFEFDSENPAQTLTFSNSKENQLYTTYQQKSMPIRQQLNMLQRTFFSDRVAESRAKKQTDYKEYLKKYDLLQIDFETETKGMLANSFVKASKKFYAETLINTPQEYLNSIKQHYFDFINFTDTALINSTFISESVLSYVLYLNVSEDVEMQKILHQNAVKEVMQKMEGNYQLTSDIATTLLYAFAQQENVEIMDFIYGSYYIKLPQSLQNKDDIEAIFNKVKLAVGRVAPDFSFGEQNNNKKLYSLNGSAKYVLVFWSSGCSHCVIEVPELYEFMQNIENVQVIDIAMEENDEEFSKYNKQFKNWTNVLALGKWENPIAKDYQIVSTPTYFVLDAAKKIIAKPEELKDVKAYFSN